MSESIVNAISSVRPAEHNVPVKQPAVNKTEGDLTSHQAAPVQEKSPAQEKTVKPVEKESLPLVGNASNVSLQFRVDEKTKDVTVFVVDRSTKRVVRSIPASELAKLQAGDLLKLTA